jgi:hypothetical protein
MWPWGRRLAEIPIGHNFLSLVTLSFKMEVNSPTPGQNISRSILHVTVYRVFRHNIPLNYKVLVPTNALFSIFNILFILN